MDAMGRLLLSIQSCSIIVIVSLSTLYLVGIGSPLRNYKKVLQNLTLLSIYSGREITVYTINSANRNLVNYMNEFNMSIQQQFG